MFTHVLQQFLTVLTIVSAFSKKARPKLRLIRLLLDELSKVVASLTKVVVGLAALWLAIEALMRHIVG